MRSLRQRTLWYGFIIMLGLLSALPAALPGGVQQRLPDWYANNQFSLGLDLRGGSHLLLAVDMEDLLQSENQQFADSVADRLRQAGIRYLRPQATAEQITVTLRDASAMPELIRIARESVADSQSALPTYTLDSDAGTLTLLITDAHREALQQDAVTQSLDIIHRRLDETGMVEPSITRQGSDSIVVQLPGISDPGRVKELLGTTAKMNFHWLADSRSTDIVERPGQQDGEIYRLERQIAMEGRHVRNANMVLQPQTGLPVVNFVLDKTGGRLFGDMTQENIGRALAVVLDDQVITAPVIRSAITTGSGEISGGFSAVEATDLAMLLRAGALPAALDIIEERSVGPSLGSDSIQMGLITGLIGAGLVLLFMAAIYGSWGLIAWLGLGINMGLIFGVLSLLGATLTLPGIAGLILVMGMAVDANILINERIRDELRQGKTAWLSLENGFSKAYSTIIDSNVTTLIAISLLFLMGSGPVRGFAVTMGIGLLTSLFTAVAVTRVMMEWRIRLATSKTLSVSGLAMLDRIGDRFSGGKRVINFMRASIAGLVVSAILSTAAVGLLAKPGLNYGIDFSGGALVEVSAPDTTIEQLRSSLVAAGLDNISVQETGDIDGASAYQLRQPLQTDRDSGAVIEEIKAAIMQVSPDADVLRSDMVGPRVSGDFADLSILAVLLAGGGMLLYLWYRFENHFAVAAVITIGLDLTKTLGFFALAGIEFNLTAVAALLALIGYSVNDKVVVFDRIRENLRAQPDQDFSALVDRSISATLTRTVFTSLSTLVAIVPMAIAGGSAVSSFALPMLFGIVISTSSSIFIAAPIVVFLGKRRQRQGRDQLHTPAPELDMSP
ncbi:protein translocase subunit SecD [Pseudohongiella sp.]|uniref:SSD domain-containing protein n=1 Tax=marine sediment metagenome TaxID=412755 RepID=A0A0F9YLF2_9ZZZZ|nr:protein translocase subunit SecD [Pseudohongiella sp.]HDZ10375.1 protein translocase subunit SecD [Pseudohongiella sp.]HEA62002.1 protein translocase subunit SecD [Pseudohongiella sp.]